MFARRTVSVCFVSITCFLAQAQFPLAAENGAALADYAARTLKLSCSSIIDLDVEDAFGETIARGATLLETKVAETNFSVELYQLPRKRAVVEAHKGLLDGLCACVSDETLSQNFHLSEPMGFAPVGVVFEEKTIGIVDIGSLQGSELHVGVVSVDHLDSFAEKLELTNFERIATHEQAHLMLELGRVDVLLVRKSNYRKYWKKVSQTEKYSYLELTRPTFHFCMRGRNGVSLLSSIERLKGLNPSVATKPTAFGMRKSLRRENIINFQRVPHFLD